MTTMAQGTKFDVADQYRYRRYQCLYRIKRAPCVCGKADPRMYFRGRRRQRGQGANQVLIDTERPEVDLRIAQTMGTDDPINMHKNDAALKDSIHLVSDGSKISLLSASVTQSS